MINKHLYTVVYVFTGGDRLLLSPTTSYQRVPGDKSALFVLVNCRSLVCLINYCVYEELRKAADFYRAIFGDLVTRCLQL